ncbi:hypothetical protein [Nocardia salmonicida]|uniref:hypothetical protein n=1 Tax=Nocardia salmonicida TaxID=53431 RepID=UPI0012F4FB46|nr:hypothetical protein [Nocardia salmonicida]
MLSIKHFREATVLNVSHHFALIPVKSVGFLWGAFRARPLSCMSARNTPDAADRRDLLCSSDGCGHADRDFGETIETTDSTPNSVPVQLVTVAVRANEQTDVIADAADQLPPTYRVAVVSGSVDRSDGDRQPVAGADTVDAGQPLSPQRPIDERECLRADRRPPMAAALNQRIREKYTTVIAPASTS